MYLQQNNNRKPYSLDSQAEVSRNEINNEGIDEKGQRRLQNIKSKFFLNDLVRKIKYLIPPLTFPYKIYQEWEAVDVANEEKKKNQTKASHRKETLSEEITSRNTGIQLFQACEGILLIVFLWMMSVSIIFEVQILQWLSILVLVFNVGKMVLKFMVLWFDKDQENTYKVYWVEDFLSHIFLIATSAIMLIRDESIIASNLQYALASFCILVLIYQIKDIGIKFSVVTIYAEQYKKRKQLRIIELFGFTIAMAHLFALIMYETAQLSTYLGEINWLQKADLVGKSWHQIYIYSFYWANTTMVTVGYGDITPANVYQAFIVTIIQIVGTAIFGYMINVIGITVNEIQKKALQFQEHQTTIHKLRDHYQLSRQLCFKMKNDIKQKQSLSKSIPLKKNEQRQFLDYIDQNLRNDFVKETNMKVLKKSIFFLTHFTVNFQNKIAVLLVRNIYKPQDVISLIDEDQDRQLLIINNGIVDLYTVKQHNKLQITKFVRSIQPKEGKPTLNVYGFSSLILNRNINLKAVTRQSATVYILSRKKILQCITKSTLDFESFNQLREKMLQIKQPEQIEAPTIGSQDRHFLPNLYLLIKKVKKSTQERTKYVRSPRRMERKIITMRNYQNKTLLMIDLDREKQSQDYEDVSLLKINQCDNALERIQTQPIIIDQVKIFEHFLVNCNLNQVSAAYQKFCMKKRMERQKIATQKRKRQMQ